jgi:hypothetical protein
MVDYSKWDNIQDSDDENDTPPKSALPSNLASTAQQLQVRTHIRIIHSSLYLTCPGNSRFCPPVCDQFRP